MIANHGDGAWHGHRCSRAWAWHEHRCSRAWAWHEHRCSRACTWHGHMCSRAWAWHGHWCSRAWAWHVCRRYRPWGGVRGLRSQQLLGQRTGQPLLGLSRWSFKAFTPACFGTWLKYARGPITAGALPWATQTPFAQQRPVAAPPWRCTLFGS
jgi:hypothetical protein